MKLNSSQIDCGINAGQLIALDEYGRLPPVDASQLKNLPIPNYIPQTEEHYTVDKYEGKSVKERIRLMVEDYRQSKMFIGPAEFFVFLEKTEQAIDFLSDGCPEDDAQQYPLIFTQASLEQKTCNEIAIKLLQDKKSWLKLVNQTEIIKFNAFNKISQNLPPITIISFVKQELDKI